MAKHAISPATIPATFAELLRAVEKTIVKGQQAVDQAKVRTYWETGWLIKEHVLLFKERADHGACTIRRLSAKLKIDGSVLHRCVRFVECFPNVATWPLLTWAHFRTLIPIADTKLRLALASEADRKEWTVVQLEQHLRTLAPPEEADISTIAVDGIAEKPLTPKRGTPGLCQVIEAGGARVVDLGFACYLDLPPSTGLRASEGADFAAGSFVQFDATGRITAAVDAGKAGLFTYTAAVLKVVDGDTLWVKVYLRPRQWVKQKLRLRDLDCPEMNTAEGRAAKRFVDALIARTTAVTICTTKPDKYDRYLADVFLTLDDGTAVYLNNALLENGHAVRKEEWEFGDWGV